MVASRVAIPRSWASPADILVREKGVALQAIGLEISELLGKRGVEMIENILSDLSVNWLRGSAEKFEVDVEPLILRGKNGLPRKFSNGFNSIYHIITKQ